MSSVVISYRSVGFALCAGQAREADRGGGGDERTAASQVSSFYHKDRQASTGNTVLVNRREMKGWSKTLARWLGGPER